MQVPKQDVCSVGLDDGEVRVDWNSQQTRYLWLENRFLYLGLHTSLAAFSTARAFSETFFYDELAAKRPKFGTSSVPKLVRLGRKNSH